MSERIEGYKHIPGYEGIYIVNEYGDVRSIIFNDSGKQLKRHRASNGYLMVNLSKNCKSRHFSIHRIVATTFIKNPNNKPAVNHKDGDKLNNYVGNLEWVTNKENHAHARLNGLIKLSGSDHPLSKLDSVKVIAIRALKGHLSQGEIGELFGVSRSAIHLIQSGKSYKNAGIVGREG